MSRDHFSISFDRGVFRICALEFRVERWAQCSSVLTGGMSCPRQLDFKPHLACTEGCGARVGPW